MSHAAIERGQYLEHLDADIDAFATAVETGPADAPVPWCGSWSLADLGRHLGGVHRWAAGAARHATPAGAAAEDAADPAPQDPAQLGGWLRAGGARLLDVLGALDLAGPTWHPFPVDRVGAVWPRRQAQETAVHRWDAQQAIGAAPTLHPGLAADGIDEYFALALPRLIRREGLVAPASTLRVETTDTGDVWLVAGREGSVAVVEPGAGSAPTCAIVGTAEHVLLTLWGRPVPAGAVGVDGAPLGWLDLGGM